MDHIYISTYGFPGALSELVGRGAMGLPPLNHADDAEFLRAMTAVVTMAFWARFLASLPRERQEEAASLYRQGKTEALQTWMEGSCNVLQDQKAMQRANRVLAQLQATFPALMAEEYARFRSQTTV